jgi:Beta-lactamase
MLPRDRKAAMDVTTNVKSVREILAGKDLAQVFDRQPLAPACSACVVVIEESTETVAVRAQGEHFGAEVAVPVGCFVRTIVALLVTRAIRQGLLAADVRLRDLLPGYLTREMEPVLLHHLLTSSHGLDDATFARHPRDSLGYLDASVLRKRLNDLSPIAEPGSCLINGGIGHAIVVHILEKLWKIPIADQILCMVNEVADSPVSGGSRNNICGVLGGELRLSADQIASVVRTFALELRAKEVGPVAALRRHSYKPQQWHPLAQRVCFGWLESENGVFISDGRGQAGSMSVLWIPERKEIVLVTARGPATRGLLAKSILDRMFKRHLVKISNRLPPIAALADRHTLPAHTYCGKYANSLMSVTVSVGGGGTLVASADSLKTSTDGFLAIRNRSLNLASGNIFFPHPPEPVHLPVVTFTHPDRETGRFEYLHTPKYVLRRCSADETSEGNPRLQG